MIIKLKRLVKITVALAVMYACAFLGYQFARLEPSLSGPASEQHARMRPTLVAAVTEADSVARETARAELGKWREKVMQRVDPAFLDWYFDYFQWRRSGAIWIWRRMLTGKEYADAKYVEEIADKFAENVVSPQDIEAEMLRISRVAAAAYRDRLATGITAVRDGAGENLFLVDAELDNITVVGRDDNDRKIFVSLHEIASRGPISKKVIELLARAIRSGLEADAAGLSTGRTGVAAIIATTLAPAVKAGTVTAATALGVSKGMAATAGIAGSAVFVVAVIAVGEWLSYGERLKDKPVLRKKIEESLNAFVEAALRDNGRLGIGVHEISAQLNASIESQGSLWGIVTARTRRALSI